jgi:cation diffusion facilitator CzcD-associated flavoprotein CzcO/acetyl esterase/lipase
MNPQHDVVVVGAGFAGLYAVHKLRDGLGLAVAGFEAADGVGGTWWWNRYPGARCDFESVHYSYSFSPDLQREWEWTERYAAQPEILSYLEWVAEKLDLRRSFQFNTRVTSLEWDDETHFWTVRTSDGKSCTSRFVVSGVGNLSVPKEPDFPGADMFQGDLYWTSRWPQDEVDFTGKRVAVIGTGSTGIQVIPELAKQAAHVTVFQRTANFAAPLGNAPVEPSQRRWNAEHHDELRSGARDSFLGVPLEPATQLALDVSDEQRRRVYDEYWEKGGFGLLASTFSDLVIDEQANETLAEYIRGRIHELVEDPSTAELLSPNDHPYGSKRPPFETDYYETFNRPNVDLIDARSTPIEEITPKGIRTSQTTFEFDAIVLATGFDAVTGPLLELNMTGRDSLALEKKWADGPTSYLGIQIADFPNFFMITGPKSAALQYNTPLAIEDHVDFVANAIAKVAAEEAPTFEATREAEQAWGDLTEGVLHLTVIPKAKGSWYMGENVPGKPRATYLFPSGAPLYRAICFQVEQLGFAGFAIGGVTTPVPPFANLEPSTALLLIALLNQGLRPLHEYGLEELRSTIDSLTQLQAPAPEMRVEVLSTPPGRLYVPESQEPMPTLLFFHGGGWMAGSPAAADAPCRNLAADLGAIVFAVEYRLTPEHPFPAAPDDAFAALQWAREHIKDYGGDPERLVVMGESAGANLAAVTALRARDEGIDLAAQILLYPPIDPDAQTASRTEFVGAPFFSTEAINAMWMVYLNGAEVTAMAAPSRAASLAGLPPTLLLTAECDPLRDEGEDYGRALHNAGVSIEQHRLNGQLHAALNMDGFIPAAQQFRTLVGEFAGRHLVER